MSLIQIPLGVFSAIYIGDSDGVAPLTQIIEPSTGDHHFVDQTPMRWFNGLRKQLQVGPRTVTVDMDFLSDDILLYNLTHGVSVDNTDKNTPPEGLLYSLLLVFENDEDDSIYIPECRTERVSDFVRSKTRVTSQKVIFTAEDPNRYSSMVYYDTIDNLHTLLAGRSPL